MADNPDAYLIRRDIRKCFKNINETHYPTKDSRVRLNNNAPVADDSMKTTKDITNTSAKNKKERKDNLDKPSSTSTRIGR